MVTKPPSSPLINLTVTPETLRVDPGDQAVFQLTIENYGQEPQAQEVSVRGLPAGWVVEVDFDSSRLAFPREQRSGTVYVSVPPDARVQEVAFQITAEGNETASEVACRVNVGGAPSQPQPPPPTPARAAPAAAARAPEVSLSPALLIWRGTEQTERVILNVRNTGSTETDYTIEVQGLEAAWYTLQPQIRVPPGHAFEAGMTLHPPLGAGRRDYPYKIIVRPSGASDAAAEAPGWLSIPSDNGAPPAAAPAPAPTPVRPAPAQPVETVTPPDVTIAPRTTFRFGPGEISAQAILTVHNRSKVAERYRLWIEGLPENWYALSTADVRLEPGTNSQVPLRLTPRTGPGMPAGNYEFRVRAAPQSLPEAYGEAVGLITIAGVSTFDGRLTPVQADGRKRTFSLSLMNTGDLPLKLQVEARDPEGKCRLKVPQPRELDPGQQVILPIKVGAKRIGLFGPPETFDFRVRVTPEEGATGSSKAFDARFVHRPLMGLRVPFIACFLGLLAAITLAIVFLASPAIGNGFTWIGCQLDSQYRLSADSGYFTREECGGRPRQQVLEEWQRQSALGPVEAPRGEIAAEAAYRSPPLPTGGVL